MLKIIYLPNLAIYQSSNLRMYLLGIMPGFPIVKMNREL